MGYQGSWSGMRRWLEWEMTAEALRGRVRYQCTRFVGMDNDHLYEVFVDGNMVKRFSFETVRDWLKQNEKLTEPSTQGIAGYWNGFWDALDSTPMDRRNEYTDREFADALGIYRQQDIGSSLRSDNPIVRMFAVLDRRAGKRTLEKLKDKIDDQPEWLRFFYQLRLNAEGKTDQL